MKHLNIDIETYSSVDIKNCGSYKYILSPDFEIQLIAYSWDGGVTVEQIDVVEGTGAVQMPQWFIDALSDPSSIKHASNAEFEWFAFSTVLRKVLPIDQWRCTALHSRYCGHPGNLKEACASVGIPDDMRKLDSGTVLINYFAKPCKATKANGGRTRNMPHDNPEKWEQYKEYNIYDVKSEGCIERYLDRWAVPDWVQREWELSITQNFRGVSVAPAMIAGAQQIAADYKAVLNARAKEISGLANPGSTQQVIGWLARFGIDTASVDKAHVQDILDDESTPEAVQEFLRIRQRVNLSSLSKYDAMDRSKHTDNKVRGCMLFYGASRTGRAAGRLIQVQNITRSYIANLPLAREAVMSGDVDLVTMMFGDPSKVLTACIRSTVVASEGCKFVDADFSAIEARVIAWLAGEEWVLEVFRTHGKIYEATASQMFGVPLESISKGQPNYKLRAQGKVAQLACGYGGSVGAMAAMDFGHVIPEDEYKGQVDKWREANPAIVRMWKDYERAAIRAIHRMLPRVPCGRVTFGYECDAATRQSYLTVLLPSGRKLFYVEPQIGENRWGNPSITHMGYNNKATAKVWARVETYGGKLVENITQAVARDLIYDKITKLEANGIRVPFSVHDEVVCEMREGDVDLARVIKIMNEPVPWARGLPLNAEGWVDDYYKKD